MEAEAGVVGYDALVSASSSLSYREDISMTQTVSSPPDLERLESASASAVQASAGPGDAANDVSEDEEESEEMEDSNRAIEDEPETKR
jgi:hypothetical protein